MKRTLLTPLIAAGLLAATPSLAAPDDGAKGDVRCLVVSMGMASSSDQTLSKAGYLSMLYFIGRLDGRDPNFDLEAALTAEAKSMTPDDLKANAARCGAILTDRGAALQAIGEDLRRLGAEPHAAS